MTPGFRSCWRASSGWPPATSNSRIEVSPARDELDAIIMGTNLLAEDLQIIYEELEQRVEVRTQTPARGAPGNAENGHAGPAHRAGQPFGAAHRAEVGAVDGDARHPAACHPAAGPGRLQIHQRHPGPHGRGQGPDHRGGAHPGRRPGHRRCCPAGRRRVRHRYARHRSRPGRRRRAADPGRAQGTHRAARPDHPLRGKHRAERRGCRAGRPRKC